MQNHDPNDLAEVLFAASCDYHGYPVNMGRSHDEAPLGFKTCGSEYKRLADVAIEWMEKRRKERKTLDEWLAEEGVLEEVCKLAAERVEAELKKRGGRDA